MIGKSISHYKILEKLGEGGMGVVYKAEDTKLKRTVALKFLPSHLTKNERDKARFLQEAQAAAALNHNNVCTIHEICNEHENPFIVMEYVEGKTLRIIAGEGQALPLKDVTNYAIQIAEALKAAHNKGIVHRDIKSENIMVTETGQIKVMDFGLAKLRGSVKLTKSSSIFGTVAYMSPEYIEGKKIDTRADIFSFGVVLYEMLTGKLPFKGDYDSAMMYAIVNEEHEPIQKHRTDLSSELLHVLDRALEKNPEERYQSVHDMLIDLRRLRRDMAVPSEPSKPAVISKGSGRITRFWPLAVGFVLIVLLAVINLPRIFTSSEKASVHDRKMLVVLPFRNLGAPEDEYFSDGITDAITARLTRINTLGVITRQSAFQYKNSDKNSQEIGRELGVSYILEGTIQRERPDDPSSRVRIIPQLIKAAEDINLWAGTYDENMKEIFQLQTAIAESVATALNVVLLEPERQALEEKPTDNLEAYNYYLQGRQYFERSQEKSDMEIAIELFEKAIQADPSFAEAYAVLAQTHLGMRWSGYDTSQERLARAKEAVDKALSLKPEEPLVRQANGFYYYRRYRDYARALDEFMFCKQKEPGNATYIANIAYIQRRLGKFEQAVENLKIAFHYHPRSSELAYELGNTYTELRLYEEAEGYYDRAISLAPDIEFIYILKQYNLVYQTGDTESARMVLEEALKRVKSDRLIWYIANIDIYDGKYQDALERLSSIREEVWEEQAYFTPKDAIRGFIYELMGQTDQARILYQNARIILEKKAKELPDDPRIHVELGRVLAHLGLKNEAIREVQTVINMIPSSRDAFEGPYYEIALAEIYTIVGDYEAAIDKLEYLLKIPVGIHIGELKVKPVWDPLRNQSRFQRLLAKGK